MTAGTATESAGELRHSARGSLSLVFSQGCFMFLGYLFVVLLARGLGPDSYAAYGVVLSVLVWLEQAGQRSIPFASAKLLAEAPDDRARLENGTLALNVGFYLVGFLAMWIAAPWLGRSFGIENGTFLFRLAAIDLPVFGLMTAAESIHQGHRRFFRLSLAKIAYASAKLLGLLAVIWMGLTVEKALVVNVVATVAGLAALVMGLRFHWSESWTTRVSQLVRMAIPIGLYSFGLQLLDNVNLWALQILSPAEEASVVGVFIAALNIARVPGVTLAIVTLVLLPSISRALSRGDGALAGSYINQGFRIFLLLFLPAWLALAARPEELMQLIYSNRYSGGGPMLEVLVVGGGLNAIAAILGSILISAGHLRFTAAATVLSLIPSSAAAVAMVEAWGARGAALSSLVIPAFSIVILAWRTMRDFGPLLKAPTALRIAAAGIAMFAADRLLPRGQGLMIGLHAVPLLVYAGVLLASRELKVSELTHLLPTKGGE